MTSHKTILYTSVTSRRLITTYKYNKVLFTAQSKINEDGVDFTTSYSTQTCVNSNTNSSVLINITILHNIIRSHQEAYMYSKSHTFSLYYMYEHYTQINTTGTDTSTYTRYYG